MSMISTDARINLGFYLFADDTNLLYADQNLKDLETIVIIIIIIIIIISLY